MGYPRADGRKGIRNTVLVAYLVECAHFVAREIALPFRERDVQVIGFPGCYPNEYALKMMRMLCTHPNVGAVLLVSLGCEGFDRRSLGGFIEASGRPSATLVIQESGGTRNSLAAGRAWIADALAGLERTPRADLSPDELIVGTICGGSDGTSGITANPAIGRAYDRLVGAGAACLFTEAGELIGCERFMAERAARPEIGQAILRCMAKATRYEQAMGHGSFAPGNAEGGLTTQEEKSMGAYAKSGAASIAGVLLPGDRPRTGGLYLVDDIPEGGPRFGYPNMNDNTKLAELMACGAQVLLFSTGRGSVVGSAIAPVIKICANPETYRRMADDMDVDAGRVLEGAATLDELGGEIDALVRAVCAGTRTRSEALGHQEFILSYKTYEAAGPACFPLAS